MARRFRFWQIAFGLSVTICGDCTCAIAGGVQIRELDYLEQAAHGHWENVFLLRTGYGYRRRTVDGYVRGWARVGSYNRVKDGRRVDIIHMHILPSNPSRIESRGRLTIEYFGTAADGSVVVVRDASDYVELLGSASVLVNSFVEASVALSGPPDVLSAGWSPLQSWSELQAWGASARRR